MECRCKSLVHWCLIRSFWGWMLWLVGSYGGSARACTEGDSLTFLSWNLENWFDPVLQKPYDDPAFTPQGEKHWTWDRFRKKRNRIVRTLLSVEGIWGSLPDVVACCEVENRWVLQALLEETVLSKADYVVVHHEGADPRGIECGLLFRTSVWECVSSRAVPVPGEGSKPLRPILYACLREISSGACYHFLVNHWPSRLGGSTQVRRMRAATALLAAVDSIRCLSPTDAVVALGDFNEGPDAEAIRALSSSLNLICPGVRDPAWGVQGSVRYRGKWDLIDLVLVSVAGQAAPKAWIHVLPDLVEEEKRWLGVRPFRTYQGPRYVGGLSDHFPIVVRFPKNS